jgi:hypothetical protein
MTRDVGDDPIPAILAALCLRPSARTPHPGVAVLLQTKGKVTFNSLMTGLSKTIFLYVSGLI